MFVSSPNWLILRNPGYSTTVSRCLQDVVLILLVKDGARTSAIIWPPRQQVRVDRGERRRQRTLLFFFFVGIYLLYIVVSVINIVSYNCIMYLDQITIMPLPFLLYPSLLVSFVPPVSLLLSLHVYIVMMRVFINSRICKWEETCDIWLSESDLFCSTWWSPVASIFFL